MVRWVYFPRLQAEMASYWLTQNDLPRARICACVSLEAAERTASRKRIAWARKLQEDIAMLNDRPDEAGVNSNPRWRCWSVTPAQRAINRRVRRGTSDSRYASGRR